MSLSKIKCWYSNNCSHILKGAVPFFSWLWQPKVFSIKILKIGWVAGARPHSQVMILTWKPY